jgi:PadR family transcriptional regulator AphA
LDAQAQAPAAGEPDPAPGVDAGAAEPVLTGTGRVILGMIGLGRRTGYEIKQLVDRSTRHFWAASYGQIYPELRRLEGQGLVSGRPDPPGGRARTSYELTQAGERALADWLSEPSVQWELRDEGMLKLFFSDLTDGEQRLAIIRAMRAGEEGKLAQLEQLQAKAQTMRAGPRLTLELGLAMTRCAIDWCEATERRLDAAAVDTTAEREAGA